MFAKYVESAKENFETIEKYNPYTMDDYLTKLSTISNITIEGISAVIDAIKDNNDNKVVLMRWEDELL